METVSDLSEFRPGAEVIFKCLEGFKMRSGSKDRITCLNTGEWSQPPKCSNLACDPPVAIENGYVQYDLLEVGATAMYLCNSGFALKDRRSANVICDQNGQWSPEELPVCQRIICEDEPVPVDYASVEITGRTLGSFANYTCFDGYKMIGPEQAICGPNGKWSDAPICLPLMCPPPRPIDNGRSSATGFGIGDIITWSCNDDYTLIGKPVSICRSDLTWSPTPKCKCIFILPFFDYCYS